jgi:zinc D-Ala-D-Ala dipeptidase
MRAAWLPLWWAGVVAAEPTTELVDVGASLPVRVELKYSTTDNFMHRDVYGDLDRCRLTADAAAMLSKAHGILLGRAPELTFVMYDCARPRSVQLIMWEVVAGTPQQGYVANPHKPPGSMHNRGCAVDLSLWNHQQQTALDMGTPYDFLGPAAEPRREVEQHKAGQLNNEQWANRLLLREVMVRAGFRVLPHEWWHFDCADSKTAMSRYPVIP